MGDDVVRGPKQPFWGCQSCGRTSNWACRLRCKCGAAAPNHVMQKAKSFGDGGGPPGDGRKRLPAAGSRREAQLNDTLAKLLKRMEAMESNNGGQKPKPGAAQQQGGGGGQATEDVHDEATDELKKEASMLESAIKVLKGEGVAVQRAGLEKQLKELRAKIEEQKPSLTQHNNLGHRLRKAKSKLAQIKAELDERDATLAVLQKERTEVEAKHVELQTEVAALQQRVLISTADVVGDAGATQLTLPEEVLEATRGKEKIKEMFESEAFKEFAALYAAHANLGGATPAAPPAPEAEGARPGGAPAEGPGPMEQEYTEAFTTEQAAEDFWERHKGDKRAILTALLEAKVKRPRTQQL